MKEYNFADLQHRYESKTVRLLAECRFVTDLVGGMRGDRPGVAMFVEHQMKLTGQAAIEEVDRIMTQEIGGAPKSIAPPEGELEETQEGVVNLIRRDAHGPWLGDWMIKACLKAAASRLNLFVQKRGTKGDMAEMGTVRAVGVSFHETQGVIDPGRRIYLRSPDGGPATTELQFFRGRISSPQGSKSIQNVAECCLAGAQFAFEYRFADGKINEDDVADIAACAMVIGLGSCKAFERGKFAIERLMVERNVKESVKEKSKAA